MNGMIDLGEPDSPTGSVLAATPTVAVPAAGETAPSEAPVSTATPAADQLVMQMLAALLRHSLTGLAGMLVTAGALQQDETSHFVGISTGVAVWLLGYAWSLAEKWMKRHGYR